MSTSPINAVTATATAWPRRTEATPPSPPPRPQTQARQPIAQSPFQQLSTGLQAALIKNQSHGLAFGIT